MTADPNSLRIEMEKLKIETQSLPSGETVYSITLNGVKAIVPQGSFKELKKKAEKCEDFKFDDFIDKIIMLMSYNNDTESIEDGRRNQ